MKTESKTVVVRALLAVAISSGAATFAQILMKNRLGAELFAYPGDRGEALSSYAVVSAFGTVGLIVGAIAADRERIGARWCLMAGAIVLLLGVGISALPGFLLVGGGLALVGAGAVTSGSWAGAHRATAGRLWARDGAFALVVATGAVASVGAEVAGTLVDTWSIGIYFLAALVVAAGLAFLIASADAFNSVAHAEHPSRHGAKAFGAQDAGFLIAFALAMAMIWAPEYSEMSAHDGFDRPFIGGVELAPWIMGLNVALSLAVTILWFWRDSAQTTSRSASRVAGGLLFWAPGILLLAVFEPSTSASVLAQITGTFAISIGGALAAPLLWSVIMARAPTRHPTLTLTAWSLGTSLVASYLIGPIVRRDEGLIPEVLFSSVGLALGLAALILARRRVKAC